MSCYQEDRAWSDRFIPAIQQIVGPLMLGPADFERDATEATDLVLLRGRNLDIACRIRRPGFAEKYPWEFTIRNHRESGARTEYEKLMNGHADWMFYGHATDDLSGISRWFLISLPALRAHLILSPGKIQMGTKPNKDGTSFRWFDIRSFPKSPPLLVASSAAEVPEMPRSTDDLHDILNPV